MRSLSRTLWILLAVVPAVAAIQAYSSGGPRLLLLAGAAIALLILLVSRCGWSPWVALAVVSLGLGYSAGQDWLAAPRSFGLGFSGILINVGPVIVLGGVFGKLLEVSGGAGVLAEGIARLGGGRWLAPTSALIGFVVGLPVFFATGLVVTVPIIFALARRSNTPWLRLAMPLVAGLSAAHGLVPPHPGPTVALDLLKADFGLTLLYGSLVGLIAALVSGPLLAPWLPIPDQASSAPVSDAPLRVDAAQSLPGFAVAFFFGLLPIWLLLAATLLDRGIKAGWLPADPPWQALAAFGTHAAWGPATALSIAVACGAYVFGVRAGFPSQQFPRIAWSGVRPMFGALLVVGAGGGFNRVLNDCGVGIAIQSFAAETSIPPLLLGWTTAALVRIATGSATVAVSAAAGILAEIVTADPSINRPLLVVAMGAGSLILSHVNDGGFWLVKEYLRMSVRQTLATWTVVETVLSLTGLASVLALDAALRVW